MRMISGIQPTGNIHIGNYFGAIKKWVNTKNEDSLYFMADLHSLTAGINRDALISNTRDMVATMMAAGLTHPIFKQSEIPAHSQLLWILLCSTNMGHLNRMPQYKSKSDNDIVGTGVFAYPVLQAADILLYDATHVPVGEDQKSHIELTRDIAKSFNYQVNDDIFTIPEPVIQGEGSRIMSLIDANNKMSKSDPNDMSRINLNDSDDVIAKKIKKATTDSELFPEQLSDLDNRPEARNLINIMACVSDLDSQTILSQYSGKGYGALKPDLTEGLISVLKPIKSNLVNITLAEVDERLLKGKIHASVIANKTLRKVEYAIGTKDRTADYQENEMIEMLKRSPKK